MTPTIPYLTTQLETSRAILFTGAGFSMAAKNVNGQPMPSAGHLKEALWKLCFSDDPVDPTSTLQNVYEAALMRNERETKELLTSMLSVDGSSLPEWYSLFFKLPWFKCYTLNIDDLAQRVGNKVWLNGQQIVFNKRTILRLIKSELKNQIEREKQRTNDKNRTPNKRR
jgi:hypothetical protein